MDSKELMAGKLVAHMLENGIRALRTENAALKEQITNAKYSYLGAMADCKRYEETIAQQAEAIRLKDVALDWCIGEFNLRLYDIDLSQETIRVRSARHIQPSPEILEARDERVAEAIAEAIGGCAYDCTRVWGAWGYGTMSEADFVPVVDQSDRIAEIASAAIAAMIPS